MKRVGNIVVQKKVAVASLGKSNMAPSDSSKKTAKGGQNLTKNKNTKGC